MSYNGKVWNTENSGMDNISERHIDIQIPNEVMEQLYIPIDGSVFISDNGNLSAKLKFFNP